MKSYRSARCLSEALALRSAVPRTSTRALTNAALRTTSRPSQLSQSPRTISKAQFTTTTRNGAERTLENVGLGHLNQTSLFDFHTAHGAQMVEFAGYAMPVLYKDMTMLESHLHTRNAASLFDVGHMVQHHFEGPGAAAFLEKISPSDVKGLPVHGSTLSALLWPTGGICDDLIITKLWEDRFYVVTNAGCRDKDLAFINKELASFDQKVEWTVLEGQGLVALQGPKAAQVLQSIVVDPQGEGDLSTLYFGQSRYLKVKGPKFQSSLLLVSRAGYTGEDGFEISIPKQETEDVAQLLLDTQVKGEKAVKLAGLGARDSLRLEAGMCLYGHDLLDEITPVEAGLSWIIGKRRRAEGGFNGAETILEQLKPKSKGGKGVERRRVGFTVTGPPAREGAEIKIDDVMVGQVTSGCPSPCLGKNIAMGYINDGLHKSGTEVDVIVRGKARKGVVTKMPFLETKYYKQ